MTIPFVNLKTRSSTSAERAICGVIKSGRFILGPEVDSLEKRIAAYCGTRYAAGVASGTDALLLSLLSCGIGPGDEVITTPFTFIATTESIARCGARPVFADIDLRIYNMDPEKIPSRITKKTKAILPVHLFGHSCDMEKIMAIAKAYKLRVIEDCAQAMGTLYKKRHVGSIGDAGCLSFYPTKNLGCYGDGGMVITNDKRIAERIRTLRNHGTLEKYRYNSHGFNSRLDTLQAAVLIEKLKHLNTYIKRRQEIASLYTSLLAGSGAVTPYIASYTGHSFNYYTIRHSNRNKIRKYLSQNNISTEIYYPLCLHLQDIYIPLGYKKGGFPVAERCEDEVLSIPIYPELTKREITHICTLINESLKDT